MANTSRTIEYNHLLTSTREKLHKSGVPQDAVFNAIPTLKAMREGSGFKVATKGGEVIRINLINARNDTGTSYSGYETNAIVPQDEFTIAYDQWRQYKWNVAISGIEKFKNGGSAEKIFDLLMEKEKVAMMSATEDINQDLWKLTDYITNADGTTGNGGKKINPIPMIADDLPGTHDWAVHGVNAFDESWWQNKTYDATSVTTGSGLLSAMRNLVNSCNQTRGGGMADLIAMDQVSHEMFEAVLDYKVRYMNTDKASPGFQEINWKGTKVIWDPYVPNADTAATEQDGGPAVTLTAGTAYVLNSNCLKLYVGDGFDFSPTPFVDTYFQGQDASVSLTLLYAQLICDSRRNQGVMFDLPTSVTIAS